MPATFAKVKTVITGETITATDRNAEFDNFIANMDFSGLGDYSDTLVQMRSTVDPYPSGSPSLATDGKGELERLRFQVLNITGKTYWYEDPAASIETIVNGTLTFAGAKTFSSAVIISALTNQLQLGTQVAGNAITITAPAPAANRTYTIPDAGTAAEFLLTQGGQTIVGGKTFQSSTLKLQEAGSTDVVTVAVAALTTGRIYTVPEAGADASFVMTEGAQTIAGTKTMAAPIFTGLPKFFSSGGSGLRVYGSSGSHQWDMYLSGTDLRFSDNTGGGLVVFDQAINPPVGSLAAPGVKLGNAADGLYVTGSGATTSIGMACRGVAVLTSNSAGLFPQVSLEPQAGIKNSDGLVGSPSYSFASWPTTGFYVNGTNIIGIATAGTLRWRFTGGTFQASGTGLVIENGDGAASGPAYSFQSQNTMGMYRAAASALGFSIPNGGNFYFTHNNVNCLRFDGGGLVWFADTTTKTIDFGAPAQAFDDMYADDFNNVADIPFFDHVKDLKTGRVKNIDDLEIVRNIKPLRDKKGDLIFNENGHAIWNDDTLPEFIFARDKRNKNKTLVRDADGKPWVSMKVLAGLSLGAIGQLIAKVEDLEKELATLKGKASKKK